VMVFIEPEFTWSAGDQAAFASIMDMASSTLASTTVEIVEGSFIDGFVKGMFAQITRWLASATNGIGDVFARVFNASEKICVDGECLTRDDIRALRAMTASASSPSSDDDDSYSPSPSAEGSGGTQPSNDDASASSTPPTSDGDSSTASSTPATSDDLTPPTDQPAPEETGTDETPPAEVEQGAEEPVDSSAEPESEPESSPEPEPESESAADAGTPQS